MATSKLSSYGRKPKIEITADTEPKTKSKATPKTTASASSNKQEKKSETVKDAQEHRNITKSKSSTSKLDKAPQEVPTPPSQKSASTPVQSSPAVITPILDAIPMITPPIPLKRRGRPPKQAQPEPTFDLQPHSATFFTDITTSGKRTISKSDNIFNTSGSRHLEAAWVTEKAEKPRRGRPSKAHQMAHQHPTLPITPDFFGDSKIIPDLDPMEENVAVIPAKKKRSTTSNSASSAISSNIDEAPSTLKSKRSKKSKKEDETELGETPISTAASKRKTNAKPICTEDALVSSGGSNKINNSKTSLVETAEDAETDMEVLESTVSLGELPNVGDLYPEQELDQMKPMQPFIMTPYLVRELSQTMRQSEAVIANALLLLLEENTVPFITRYRKEYIGTMTDTDIREALKAAEQYTALQLRKRSILKSIKSRHPDMFTESLQKDILSSTSMTHLEDLYAPYKPKKNSYAQRAIEAGLGPIADLLFLSPLPDEQVLEQLPKLVTSNEALESIEDVVIGITHIWAEKLSDSTFTRDALRPLIAKKGVFSCKKAAVRSSILNDERLRQKNEAEGTQTKNLIDPEVFEYYFDYKKHLSGLRAHNILAMNRGEANKVLKIKLEVPEFEALRKMCLSIDSLSPNLQPIAKSLVPIFGLLRSSIPKANDISSESTADQSNDGGYMSMNHIVGAAKRFLLSKFPPTKGITKTKKTTKKSQKKEDSAEIDTSSGLEDKFIALSKSQSLVGLMLSLAMLDSFRRLLFPSLVTETRRNLTEMAEKESIKTFAMNLKHRLLEPPVAGQVILGIDPGFISGCKCAVIDETGKPLNHFLVFIHDGAIRASYRIIEAIEQYNVTMIALGDKTAAEKTMKFVNDVLRTTSKKVKCVLVNEDGASVYSVSDEAKKELPDYDVHARGAISIARRLLDPLAELVKIPTRSIGVGTYQHDISSKDLEQSLDGVVEDCVNFVGVNLNTASHSLLRRISGITLDLAKKIVAHREIAGVFRNRKSLMKVKGFNERHFTQAAGFLRIPDSEEPLDSTNIHPESYSKTYELIKNTGFSGKDMVDANRRSLLIQALDNIDLDSYSKNLQIGIPTLQDIVENLKKPGRDPRQSEHVPIAEFDFYDVDKLQIGDQVRGKIVNVATLGCFVFLGGGNGFVAPMDIIDPETGLTAPGYPQSQLPGLSTMFEVIRTRKVGKTLRIGLRVVLPKKEL